MITHDQARLIRTVGEQPYANNMLMQTQFELIEPFLAYMGQHYYAVNQAGIDALAEYDAHFTTIERVELERLQALERKIEAFLSAMEVRADGDVDLFMGKQSINVEYLGFHRYQVTGPIPSDLATTCQIGDAIRKAFELFEVPGGEAES